MNKTLSKLIDRFQLFSEYSTPQQHQQQKDQLVQRLLDILSSHKVPSVRKDESNIANSIHNQLKETQGVEKAFRFAHLYNKLASRKRLDKKWAILYLFSQLGQPLSKHKGLPNLIDDQLIDTPAVQLARAKESHDEQKGIYVSESDLLRDLIFLFQGIDGQYICSNQLKQGIEISKSTESIVFKLAEIGWLYTKIRTFIQQHTNSPSLVRQSLCAALQQQLVHYYKLIAILEGQKDLTLKKLLVWTFDDAHKLRLMSVLVDVCKDLKGGALLSIVHHHTKHGDPFIRHYVVDLLQMVSKPFFEMLERWVYEGELDDPHDEFFVTHDPEQQDHFKKYSMREDMVPSFLSKDLAHKIFSIGKSLNFIRHSCHDDTFTNVATTFKYGEIELVEKSIEKAYQETSKSLIELLQKKYKLMEHLRALKRYLLLGQGDFIQYLMDTMWSHLGKPANTLFKHNLTGMLEVAVRSSNAQYDDPDVLNRLDVRLLEIQKNDLGWNVFSLEYHVDAPINTVITLKTMQEYLHIFHFLWRLKRVEYTLSFTWHRSRHLKHAQLTIQRMVHFIYQLQHYILLEVLECAWDRLETRIEKSIDLDAIIEAHADYLQEIMEKGFLKQGNLSRQLDDLFECILTYNEAFEHSLSKEFNLQILSLLATLRQEEATRSLATRLDYNDFYYQ